MNLFFTHGSYPLKSQILQVDFFQRAAQGLKQNGLILVKENVTSTERVEEDKVDSSVTRPPSLLKQIFKQANLEIFKELKQNKFPKELYEVHMFALKPRK